MKNKNINNPDTGGDASFLSSDAFIVDSQI